MKRRNLWMGASLTLLATAGIAGIPTAQPVTCPIDGKAFNIIGTPACTTFGGSQDFFLKVQTSCDFVTRLPRCPDSGLPLYKDFSAAEIALLKEYVTTDEYRALAARSGFAIAKKVDDFLVSKGSKPTFDFWYALRGLQHDRSSTQNDPEYMTWVREKGEIQLEMTAGVDAAVIRLVLAYADYLAGRFEASEAGLAIVRSDPPVKDHWLVQAYLARLGACLKARDTKLCPSNQQVKTDAN